MSSSIKTILSIDDSDVKAKLKKLDEHYKSTYAGWVAATDKLKQKDRELIGVKGELARMERIRTEEKAKGAQADKTILAGMNEAIKAHKDTIRVLQAEKNEIKAVVDAHNVEIQAVKKATAANQPYNQSLEQQWNHFIRIARWGGTLAGVYFAITRAWETTIGKGIELNRQIEDMGMGISALTAANTSNISSTGAYLTSMQKFNMATAMTTDTMKQLRKAAIDTPASFGEMASIFQQAYVSTSKMGKGFGLTVEEITKNTVQLSTRMANIAGAIGMPMQKALEETRSLMSGQASGDSLIASLLFGSPAAANEAMRKAKTQGPLAVKQMLDGVMSSFDVLAGVDTYTKSLAQMKGAYENLLSEMTKPIYNDLSKVFKEITKDFDTSTEAGKKNVDMMVKGMTEVYETAKDIGGVLSHLAVPARIALEFWAAEKAVAAVYAGVVLLSRHPLMVAGMVAGAVYTAVDKYVEDRDTKTVEGLVRQGKKVKILTEQGRKDALKVQADLFKDWQAQNARIKDTSLSLMSVNLATKFAKQDKERMKNLAESIKTYDALVASKAKTSTGKGSVGKGTLQGQIDLEAIGETLKIIESHKSKYLEVSEAIAKEEKKILALRERASQVTGKDVGSLKEKSVILNAISMGEQAISALKKEQSELNDKSSAKAETAAKKVAAEEMSVYALKKQAHETELAYQIYLEAQKVDEYKLDEKKLTELQKLRLKGFDLTSEAQGDELETAGKIHNTKNREHAINVALEKIYKTLTEKEEYRLKLQQAQTAELEQQEAIAGKLAKREMERYGKEMLHVLKMRQESPEFESAFGKDKISSKVGRESINSVRIKADAEAFGLTEVEARRTYDEADKIVQQIEERIAEIPDIILNVKVEGYDETSNAFASILNTMGDLSVANQAYVAHLEEATDQIKAFQEAGNNKAAAKAQEKLGKLTTKNFNEQVEGVQTLASETSKMFKSNSKAAKAFHDLETGIQVARMASQAIEIGMMIYKATTSVATNSVMAASEVAATGVIIPATSARTTAYGIEAVVKAIASLPFPANIAAGAATLAAVIAIGAKMNGSDGSGGGSESSPYSQEEVNQARVMELSDQAVVDRLDQQIELLEAIEKNGSAQKLGVERAEAEFNQSKTEWVQDVFDSSRMGWVDAKFDVMSQTWKDIEAHYASVKITNPYEMSGSKIRIRSEDFRSNPDELIKVIRDLSSFGYGGPFGQADSDKYGWSADAAQTYLATMQSSFVEIQGYLNDWAISLVESTSELRDASETMQDIYDNVTGTTLYSDKALEKAHSEITKVLDVGQSYSDYLVENIDNIAESTAYMYQLSGVVNKLGVELTNYELLLSKEEDLIEQQMAAALLLPAS